MVDIDFARRTVERPQQLSMLDALFYTKEERERPGERELRIQAERAYLDRSMRTWRQDRAAWVRQHQKRVQGLLQVSEMGKAA